MSFCVTGTWEKTLVSVKRESVCVCVCMCVYVRVRERDGERQRETERKRQRERDITDRWRRHVRTPRVGERECVCMRERDAPL